MNDVDRLVLQIAGRTYRHAGSLERDVMDELGMTTIAFWQRANQLLDDPAAALEFPSTVTRLSRLRDSRQIQRRVARSSGSF